MFTCIKLIDTCVTWPGLSCLLVLILIDTYVPVQGKMFTYINMERHSCTQPRLSCLHLLILIDTYALGQGVTWLLVLIWRDTRVLSQG